MESDSLAAWKDNNSFAVGWSAVEDDVCFFWFLKFRGSFNERRTKQGGTCVPTHLGGAGSPSPDGSFLRAR